MCSDLSSDQIHPNCLRLLFRAGLCNLFIYFIFFKVLWGDEIAERYRLKIYWRKNIGVKNIGVKIYWRKKYIGVKNIGVKNILA